MKKRICCFMMAALLLLGLALPVSAEEYTGGSGWQVVFNGERMDENFSTADLTDTIHAIQPGDQITVSVALKNTGSSGSNWYMKNEVLQSLEDSQKAAGGGAYTYRLSYTDSSGAETMLYDSENVGGEKDSVVGVGLHEAVGSLKEYFYLDSLTSGTAGQVKLMVALDGETQGNQYQSTLAKLQMNFAVEKTENDKTGANTTVTGVVRTGDDSHTVFWTVLMVCSFAAFVILLILGRRKDKKKDGDLHE